MQFFVYQEAEDENNNAGKWAKCLPKLFLITNKQYIIVRLRDKRQGLLNQLY